MPEQIAILGADHDETLQDMCNPALWSIETDGVRGGRRKQGVRLGRTPWKTGQARSPQFRLSASACLRRRSMISSWMLAGTRAYLAISMLNVAMPLERLRMTVA